VRHNLRLAAVGCQVEISELGEIAIRHYLSRLSQARVDRGLPPLPEAVPGELEDPPDRSRHFDAFSVR
jgi:hypothetical protein